MSAGFVLTDAAVYSFNCQDVYPDLLSFVSAIPDHLRPLFVIPVELEIITSSTKVANSLEADLFGQKTFVYDEDEPLIPSSEPGSIFDFMTGPEKTKHQEFYRDENIQSPTNTSYMTDVDMSEYFSYPYRTDHKVTHSSVAVIHLALKPEQITPKTPKNIKENARSVKVSLTSYDPKTKIFTFSANAGNGEKVVQAKLTTISDVAISCNCPYWKYNGPEYHAKHNDYLLNQPSGSATTPDIRDPERKIWLCKHAYAVLKKFDEFVGEIVDENWELTDEELLESIDNEWDRLNRSVNIPVEKIDEQDIDLNIKVK